MNFFSLFLLPSYCNTTKNSYSWCLWIADRCPLQENRSDRCLVFFSLSLCLDSRLKISSCSHLSTLPGAFAVSLGRRRRTRRDTSCTFRLFLCKYIRPNRSKVRRVLLSATITDPLAISTARRLKEALSSRVSSLCRSHRRLINRFSREITD